MARSEKAVVTVLCMVHDGTRLLLQNRVKADWRGYTLPGGHVEKGESFVQAVTREMREETGLTVHAPRLCGIKQFQTDADERYIVLLFKTDRFSGTLRSSEEGEMVWVERDALDAYPLVEDFRELLSVFDRDDLTEFQYERAPGTPVALGAGSERTVRIPLERYVDRNGLWLLSVSQQQDNAKIDRMEVNGPDTAYTIIRNGQKTNPFNDLRLYIDERNRTADLILALSNRSQRSDTLTLGLRPSPYIEPPVRVTSSLVPSKRFPLRNASDYHFGTYTRVASPCKAGDYILFTFEEPVDCESVDLRTGIPNVTRYIVTKGRVAWSSDGRSFIEAGPLNESGQIVWKPHKPVRAIRVSIEGSNGETAVCWQDLRITPTR